MADDAALPSIVADSLALAVVVSCDAPTLLLDGDLTVMAGSSSFSKAFQIDPETIRGQSIVKRRPIGTPDRRTKGTPLALMVAVARRRSVEPLRSAARSRRAHPSRGVIRNGS
jgi:hypothetical protein